MARITLLFCSKSVKVKLLEIIEFGYPILIVLIFIKPIQNSVNGYEREVFMSEHGCGCGCGHEHEHDQMNVTLTLDDGTELECAVLCIFPVEDKDYIALVPVDNEDDDEEGEIFLYQFIEHENEEIELLNIENDDEFEAVSDAFDELMDSEEFDEMFDDEEDDEE